VSGAKLCGHIHNSWESEAACQSAGAIFRASGKPVAVIIADYPGGGTCDPGISIVGNLTDFANMARSFIELALAQGRPTSCAQCQANFDSLALAMAALGPSTTGNC
jgi:hypothetical protein